MKKPILAFYGDDFTGSTDVMEVLQWAGIRTVLFLAPPTAEQLAEFEGLQAFGIAGQSRAMSPAGMTPELTRAFEVLKDSGATYVHYKTCSTFDSSPQIGSIGLALELGRQVFGDRPVPMLIGAPNLGRYQVFGNLFARSGLDSSPYRLDRHPTMSRHPVTPMQESDLRCVLATQTELPIELVDVLAVERLPASAMVDQISRGNAAGWLIDVLTETHLQKIGRILEELAGDEGSRFVLGSSGIEYALTAAWQRLNDRPPVSDPPTFEAVDQLLILTGSCSPVNGRQISWAEQHGFVSQAIETPRLVDDRTADSEIDRCIDLALASLSRGENLILHSSRGPGDRRIDETCDAMRRQGLDEWEVKRRGGEMIGPKLGRIVREVLRQHPLPRAAVAGGDSSGFIAREMNISALEAIAPVAPGSPLCRVHAAGPLDQMEFLFKGGQVGRDDVWGSILLGTENAAAG